MSDNFAVIGGDLRNIELVKLLAKNQRKNHIFFTEAKWYTYKKWKNVQIFSAENNFFVKGGRKV